MSKRANHRPGRPDVCVIGGAGHIGLPLAILFAAKGLHVLIYDINEEALEKIRKGMVPFAEEGAEPLLKQVLAQGSLSVSSARAEVATAATLIITIGTPVDEFMNPVFAAIERCISDLLPYLSDDQLIILRSTVYPGTTDWLDKYLQAHGKNIPVAFCPERIVQRKAIEELQTLPQIVSGTTPDAESRAADLFKFLAKSMQQAWRCRIVGDNS